MIDAEKITKYDEGWWTMTDVKGMMETINKMKMKEENDPVNFPSHYNKGGIGCIDAIKSCQGDGFKFYLQGSILKYIWRYEHKSKPIQDLEKAKWFLDKLIATVQEEQDANNKEYGDLTNITV